MKILLVEDNRTINKNIVMYLRLKGFHVEWVYDGQVGYEKAMNNDYDIVLLDLMIPGMDGVTLCKKILEQKKLPIVMITAKDTVDDRILGLDSWADDYIVKPFDLGELLARINAVVRRGNKEIYDTIIYRGIEIDLGKKEVRKRDVRVELTLKEFLILEYLIKNCDKSVSRTDIISYLWGWDEGLFEGDNKLDVYISNLRKKLDKDLIETIKGFWYRINLTHENS